MESHLMGMRLLVGEWRGIDEREILQFDGSAPIGNDDPRDAESDEIDISMAVIDLLSVGDAGDWHVPTEAELLALTSQQPESPTTGVAGGTTSATGERGPGLAMDKGAESFAQAGGPGIG